jgi:hypothetical protein
MAKARKQRQSLEIIKAQTGIQQELIDSLENMPTQEIRPLALMQWAKNFFKRSKELGHSKEETAEWVKVYAERGNWSQPQISKVLLDNGVRERSERSDLNSSRIKHFRPVTYIATFKRIVRGHTGLKELDISQLTPRQLVEKAEKNLREIVTRMDDASLREYPKQMAYLQALFTRMDEMIEQKKSVIRHGEISR